MDIITAMALGIGLSMDSLALSITCGLRDSQGKKLALALKVAVVFALVQFTTPILGWIAGIQFKDFITEFDHWAAFVLLGLIGGNMIRESIKGAKEAECVEGQKTLTILTLLGMGIATSIDALAVGVTFAFLNMNVWLTSGIIGLSTLVISFVGFYIGDKVGTLFKARAELLGGLILVGLGTKILIEHLFF